jgi:hypothetical protein
MSKESRTHKPEEEIKAWIAARADGLCPFVGDPFDECFVAGINSQNIDQAIHYCAKYFEECEIYLRVIKRERP